LTTPTSRRVPPRSNCSARPVISASIVEIIWAWTRRFAFHATYPSVRKIVIANTAR
jgi:hypothetical protein